MVDAVTQSSTAQESSKEDIFSNSAKHYRALAKSMRNDQVGVKNYHEMRQAIRFLEKQMGLDFEESSPAANKRRERIHQHLDVVDQWLIGGSKDLDTLQSMLVSHTEKTNAPNAKRLSDYSIATDQVHPDDLVRAEYSPSVDVFIEYNKFTSLSGFPTEKSITEMTAKVLEDQALFIEELLTFKK